MSQRRWVLVWLDTGAFPPFSNFLSDGGPRSAGWREHGERRRKFDFDLRGERGGCGEEDGRVGGGNSHLRRCRGLDGFEDDKDGLPEWCLDDEDEEMGTFDASGAFLPLKVPSWTSWGWRKLSSSHPPTVSTLPFPTQKGPKEPIPEEQELDFQGLEEEEEEPSEGVDEEGPEAGEPLERCRMSSENLGLGQVGREICYHLSVCKVRPLRKVKAGAVRQLGM